MIARQDRDERFFRHQFVDQVGIRFPTKKSDIDLSAHQIVGKRGRKPARNPDFDIGQFVAQDARRARQPRHLLPGQEADGKDRLRRLRGAARGLRGRRRLRERQPRMLKERAASRCQFDPMHAAAHKRDADLALEVANLAAERRLRRVQPLLGGVLQASRLGDRDEIAKVPQLRCASYAFRAYL
jgi:hypothetical protein